MAGYIGVVGSITYFVGGCTLLNCGDASQVSYKTIQLMFVQLLLQIPPIFYLGFEDCITAICFYAFNILAFSSISYAFRKEGSRSKRTYDPRLDDFPFHWILILPAILVPIVITFTISNNVEIYSVEEFFGVCPPFFYQFAAGMCLYFALWAFNLSMTPFMFLPQLRVCYNVKKAGGEINKNVKIFLYCMMLHSAATLIFTFFYGFLWPITTGASLLTILLLGMTLYGKTCGRENNQQDTTVDVEMRQEKQGRSTSIATEDNDLPTINQIDSPTSANRAAVTPNTAVAMRQETSIATEDYDLPTVNKIDSPTSANEATVTPNTAVGKTDSSAVEAGDWQTPAWLT